MTHPRRVRDQTCKHRLDRGRPRATDGHPGERARRHVLHRGDGPSSARTTVKRRRRAPDVIQAFADHPVPTPRRHHGRALNVNGTQPDQPRSTPAPFARRCRQRATFLTIAGNPKPWTNITEFLGLVRAGAGHVHRPERRRRRVQHDRAGSRSWSTTDRCPRQPERQKLHPHRDQYQTKELTAPNPLGGRRPWGVVFASTAEQPGRVVFKHGRRDNSRPVNLT